MCSPTERNETLSAMWALNQPTRFNVTQGRWVVNDSEPLTCWKNTDLHEFAIRTALEVNCAWDGCRLWLTLCCEKHGLGRGNGIITAWTRTRVMSSHKTGHERFPFFLAAHWKDYFSHSVAAERASEEECVHFSLFLCEWIQTNWWCDGLLSFLGRRVSLPLSSSRWFCVSVCLVKLQF